MDDFQKELQKLNVDEFKTSEMTSSDNQNQGDIAQVFLCFPCAPCAPCAGCFRCGGCFRGQFHPLLEFDLAEYNEIYQMDHKGENSVIQI